MLARQRQGPTKLMPNTHPLTNEHVPAGHSLPTSTEDPPSLSERRFSRWTCGKSRMRECFKCGGPSGNGGPYRDPPASALRG